MTSTTPIARRLATLEARFRLAKCSQCGDFPVRVVTIDGDTDTMISESMPAEGCPACGRSIVRELQIVGELTDESLESLR